MSPKKDKLSELISLPIPAKKESKRTTFNLNEQSLKAIDWIVDTYQIPAKEVFSIIDKSEELVAHAVEFAKNAVDDDQPRERKTFVISNTSLNHLNRIAKDEKIQRDRFVEKLVLFYKELLEKSLKEEEKNEKEALEVISGLLKQAEKAEAKLKALLAPQNPILSRAGIITMIIDNLESAITAKLSEGTLIDPDDFSQNS